MTEALTAEWMKDQGYLWCDGCDGERQQLFDERTVVNREVATMEHRVHRAERRERNER